jgi:hypothetical protein
MRTEDGYGAGLRPAPSRGATANGRPYEQVPLEK